MIKTHCNYFENDKSIKYKKNYKVTIFKTKEKKKYYHKM